MTKKIVFVDTNVFIQLRDLKDLPWLNVFDSASEVDVRVAQSVIEELDRHKVSQKRRLRDRARKALATIEAASREEGETMILRRSKPTVRLIVNQAGRIAWDQFEQLVPESADDRLVAEVVGCGEGACLLTHDTAPRLKARRMGLQVIVPPDDWLLPPEETEADKRVRELERQLEAERQTRPNVTLSIPRISEDCNHLRLILPILQPLEAPLTQKLVQHYLDENPPHNVEHLRSRSPLAVNLGRYGDGTYEAEKYLEEYRRFRTRVASHFARLNEALHTAAHTQPIWYELINKSPVAARGLQISFTRDSNFIFQASDASARNFGSGYSSPEPPEAPKLRDIVNYGILNRSELFSPPRPRDPTGFYWVDHPNANRTRVALQCEDFRAQERFFGKIWLYAPDSIPASGKVTLRVTASNLSEPIERTISVSFEEKQTSWTDKEVLRLLPEAIKTVIESASVD